MSNRKRTAKNRTPVTALMDWLEERKLLATFTVTSTADPVGVGVTLREAIILANTNPGLDTIAFNIPAGVPIHPATNLPDVTGPTIIDGTTQPGYSGTPLVWLEGTGMIATTLPGDGLRLIGTGSTVKGLVVSGFNQPGSAGIRLAGGGGHAVQASYIGTDPSGTFSGSPGNSDGISVNSGNNLINGNVISNNDLSGVGVTTAANGNVISGNSIGVDASGTGALGNFASGITVKAAGATDLLIGGDSAAARNFIGNNFSDGITITDVSGVRIFGNSIGADAAGGIAGNFGNGVRLHAAAGSTQIGGSAAGQGNLIIANFGDGVRITVSGTGNVVAGNLIGTNAAGAAGLGNLGNGVTVVGSGVLIGGSNSSAGNAISGNFGNGIALGLALGRDAGPGNGNSVQSNLIGVAPDGASALGNGEDGIDILGSDNVIGSPTSGNNIGYNGQVGVVVELSPTFVRNAIRGNNIFYNGGLGIDLGNNGVTLNDPMDPDVGPNNFQNFPDLTGVSLSGSTATISGTLNSTPNSTFVIDFFASEIWDPTEFGEGQKYLGSITVTTDAAGNASFTASVGGVPAGYNFFAATATDSAGNSSEFAHDPPAAPAAQSPNTSGSLPEKKSSGSGVLGSSSASVL